MSIAELTKAIEELRTYFDFNDNAEIKVETDARSVKDYIKVHVHPADGVDVYLSKRMDTARSDKYITVKGV